MLQSILFIVLILFGIYILVMNWGCVIANHRNARKNIDKYHSIALPVGALFIVVGLSL